jgi:glycerophosphoryl diester phosphodiesterase
MMDGTSRASTDSPSGRKTSTTNDDDTVVTPPRGEKVARESIDTINEKTLKFRFPPMTADDMIAPSVVHARWMCILQEEFGETVQFYDNKNQIIPRLDPIRMEQQLVKAQFLWHSQAPKHGPAAAPQTRSTDRRFTRYMLHRMRTSYSLGAIKANPKVLAFLQEHNFYVNEHRWNETEWDTTQLGFFFGTDPSFYNVDQATAKITADIQKTMVGKRIPKFKLVFTSPKVTNGKTSYSTKAYAIESQRQASQELTTVLKEVFKTTGEFVPYQMRRKHPDAFLKLVRAQTQVLAKNRVIHLNHIGSEAMYYMSDHIAAIQGIKALLPTKHIDLGQYKVSVMEKDFKRIREHLQKYIQPWYDQYVEPDARNPESKFPGPPVVAPIEADDYSEDEQSYMTVSVNTALSLVTVLSDDTLPESAGIPQTVTQHRSWAEAASDGSHTSRAAVTTAQKECDPKTSDLISALSTSQAQVDILKEQVAELRAEREETAKTIAEAVKQQVEQILSARTTTSQEAHITSQQFDTFVQSQDRKIDALTSLFTQMLAAQQQFYQAPFQQTTVPPHHKVADVNGSSRGPSLGKRNATEELETVDDAYCMETDEPDTSRKRLDYRATPQKAPPPAEFHDARKDIVPRQLMEQSSPRQVPLPDSPPVDHPSETSTALEPTDETAFNVAARPTSAQSPNFQQQSMSRYVFRTSQTNIPNPPDVVRINIDESEEVNQASLSEGEDDPQAQGSGTESETPTTLTSDNRQRRSTKKRS